MCSSRVAVLVYIKVGVVRTSIAIARSAPIIGDSWWVDETFAVGSCDTTGPVELRICDCTHVGGFHFGPHKMLYGSTENYNIML